MSKVVISNVDQDGKFEVIVYENDGEKSVEVKVDYFEIDLVPGKEVSD